MHLPGELYPATPEEVEALSRQAESLVRSRGKPIEFSSHILGLIGYEIARDLVPEGAQPFLELAAPIDFKATTNLKTRKTGVQFKQLVVPVEHPACVFKNSVIYDLTGNGQRIAEAVITDTITLEAADNPNHPSGKTLFLERAEVEQLAQLLGSSSLKRAILDAED